MKHIKLIIIIVILIVFPVHTTFSKYAGEIPVELKEAFKAGNAEEVAKYFNNSIEFDLLGNENICTKNQAEQIIKSFFEQHPVINFTILYEGGKANSKYAIGKLHTSKGTFRINLLFNLKSIVQLRIGENNEN